MNSNLAKSSTNLDNIPIISFVGYSKSGKTASIESLILYFQTKGYFICTLKHTSQENFTIDTKGKNTWRYSQAGSNVVLSHSANESALMINLSLSQEELIEFTKYISNSPVVNKSKQKPIFILEGFRNLSLKHILCASNLEDIISQKNDKTIAIAGKISSNLDSMSKFADQVKLPIVNLLEHPEKVLDLLKI
jgi:molybdopterin-guanine dinucleotide biosynthesis protein B